MIGATVTLHHVRGTISALRHQDIGPKTQVVGPDIGRGRIRTDHLVRGVSLKVGLVPRITNRAVENVHGSVAPITRQHFIVVHRDARKGTARTRLNVGQDGLLRAGQIQQHLVLAGHRAWLDRKEHVARGDASGQEEAPTGVILRVVQGVDIVGCARGALGNAVAVGQAELVHEETSHTGGLGVRGQDREYGKHQQRRSSRTCHGSKDKEDGM